MALAAGEVLVKAGGQRGEHTWAAPGRRRAEGLLLGCGIWSSLLRDSQLQPHLCLNTKCMRRKSSAGRFGGRGDKGHLLAFEIHPLMRAEFRLGGGKDGFDRRSELPAAPKERRTPPQPRAATRAPLIAAGSSRSAQTNCLLLPDDTHLEIVRILRKTQGVTFTGYSISELCGVAALLFLHCPLAGGAAEEKWQPRS